ncbi:hypothetical protein [Profundibacter sp.]
MSDPEDNPETYPALGRLLSWVDKPGSGNKIFRALVVVCGLLFIADFAIEKHSAFEMEDLPGFFAVYGFVSFAVLILAAKALRVLIKRPEDYYGNKAIDREEYPEAGLDEVRYDD